jgi:protocatechuate 3,4-dioxygenase beta subunit
MKSLHFVPRLVAIFTIAAIARCARAQEQPAQPEQPAETTTEMSHMAIRVTAAETGEPVATVELQFAGRLSPRGPANRTLRTDAEGKAELIWPSGTAIPSLRLTTRKAGFVPVNYYWRGDQNRIALPKELEIKLQPGFKVGGMVQDEKGLPIAGARVNLYMPSALPRSGYSFSLATLTTDRMGQWSFDNAPKDLSNVNANITHAEYLSPDSNRITLGTNNIHILKQGPSVRGSVVDEDGKPVTFARVLVGDSRYTSSRAQTTTDAEGLFEVRNCKLGPSYITVQPDTHAPHIQQIIVAAQNEPVKITVRPASVLRGRVVDVDGKPIAGVNVYPEHWRDMQILDFRMTTDPDGNFEWRAAPPDVVKYSIYKQGLMSLRDHVLPANGEEQVVTMNPELVITGRVTDAASGEPVKNFRLVRGQSFDGSSPSYWYQDEGTQFSGGEYTFKVNEPTKAWLLRVEAEGYLPAVSRPFASTEGKATFDFALKVGKGPSGIVLMPNGEAAAGAEIGVWAQNSYLNINQGRFGDSSQTPIVTADKDGRFTLRPQGDNEKSLLVVLHDAGFAEITSDELTKSEQITLTGWGRLEGQVLVGDKPDANRYVSFSSRRPQKQLGGQRNGYFGYGYTATTDAEGRFSFDRVVPGPGTVSRIVVTQWANYSTHNPGWNQSINIVGGETTKVTIGGTGRPVIGRLITDRDPEAPIAWTTNEPATIRPVQRPSLLRSIFGGPVNQNVSYIGNFDENGKFSIPDVPAGQYTLIAQVNSSFTPNGMRSPIGNANLNFTIPEMPGGRSDEPLDLGAITAKLLPVLNTGDAAPDAQFNGLDGKPLPMAGFRGKLLFVSFLSADRGSDLSSLALLKRIHDQFGKDPNFVMLTIWCGNDINTIKQTININNMAWQQALTYHLQSPEAQAYMIRALPTTYLIGANGKIIARNPKEAELKQSIDSLLSLGELFEFGKEDRPAK